MKKKLLQGEAMSKSITCKAAVIYEMSAKRPYYETKPLKIERH